MTEYSILIPTTDNDGRTFPITDHMDFERFVIDTAGGYTDDGLVTGVWRDDDGTVYHDTNRRYRIATTPARIRAIARWAGQRFRQKSIYISRTGTAEIIPIAA